MLLRSKSMPPKIRTMLSVAARKHGTLRSEMVSKEDGVAAREKIPFRVKARPATSDK